MFDDYFSESKRYSFVLAALGSNYSWQILPRYNVLTSLPSDFDVIRVDTFLFFELQTLFLVKLYRIQSDLLLLAIEWQGSKIIIAYLFVCDRVTAVVWESIKI